MGNECPNLEKNLDACGCTYPSCHRKGKCCECISYHKKYDELPGCLFPPDKEKTYDRSRKFYIKCFS